MTLIEYINRLGMINGNGNMIRFPRAVYPETIEGEYVFQKLGIESLSGRSRNGSNALQDGERTLSEIYNVIRNGYYEKTHSLLPELRKGGESSMQHIGGKRGLAGIAGLNDEDRNTLLGRILFLTLNYAFDAWNDYYIDCIERASKILRIVEACYDVCPYDGSAEERNALFVPRNALPYATLDKRMSVRAKDMYLTNLCYLVAAATIRLWLDELRAVVENSSILSREDNEDVNWALSQLHPVISADSAKEKIIRSTWERAFKNKYNSHTQFTDLGDDITLFDYYICPDLKRTRGNAEGLVNSSSGAVRTVLQAVSGFGKSTAVSYIAAGLAAERAVSCGLIGEEDRDRIEHTARELFGLEDGDDFPEYFPIIITGKEFNAYMDKGRTSSSPVSLADVFVNAGFLLSDGEKKALIEDIEDDPESYMFIVDAIDEVEPGKLPALKALIRKEADDPDKNILITHRLMQRSEPVNSLLGAGRSEWTIPPLNEWSKAGEIPKAELLFGRYVRCLVGSNEDKRRRLSNVYKCSGDSVEEIARSLYGFVSGSKDLCPFLFSPFTSAALIRRICRSEQRIPDYKLVYGSVNAIIDRFNLGDELDINMADYKRLISRLAHSMYQRSRAALPADKLKESFASAANDIGISLKVMMDEALLETLNEQTGLFYYSPEEDNYVFQASPASQDFLAGQDLHRIFSRYRSNLRDWTGRISKDPEELPAAVNEVGDWLEKEMDGVNDPQRCVSVLRYLIPALYDTDLFADTNRAGGPNEKALICLAVFNWLSNNSYVTAEERRCFAECLRSCEYDTGNVFAGIDPFSAPNDPSIRSALSKVIS